MPKRRNPTDTDENNNDTRPFGRQKNHVSDLKIVIRKPFLSLLPLRRAQHSRTALYVKRISLAHMGEKTIAGDTQNRKLM
jgi:hypothetical protein